MGRARTKRRFGPYGGKRKPFGKPWEQSKHPRGQGGKFRETPDIVRAKMGRAGTEDALPRLRDAFDLWEPPEATSEAARAAAQETASSARSRRFEAANIAIENDVEFTNRVWSETMPVSPEEFRAAIESELPPDVSVHISATVETTEDIWDEAPPKLVTKFLFEKNGSVIADADRSFLNKGGTLNVVHNSFSVAQQEQGSGLGKHFLRGSMKLYEEMGVETITTQANIDVGAYAWAKYGFKPDLEHKTAQAQMDNWKRDAHERLGNLIGGGASGMGVPAITDEQFQVVETLINEADVNPDNLWKIADLDIPIGKDNKLGKVVLMGSEWPAKLDLDDKEAMRRFWDYVQPEDQSPAVFKEALRVLSERPETAPDPEAVERALERVAAFSDTRKDPGFVGAPTTPEATGALSRDDLFVPLSVSESTANSYLSAMNSLPEGFNAAVHRGARRPALFRDGRDDPLTENPGSLRAAAYYSSDHDGVVYHTKTIGGDAETIKGVIAHETGHQWDAQNPERLPAAPIGFGVIEPPGGNPKRVTDTKEWQDLYQRAKAQWNMKTSEFQKRDEEFFTNYGLSNPREAFAFATELVVAGTTGMERHTATFRRILKDSGILDYVRAFYTRNGVKLRT